MDHGPAGPVKPKSDKKKVRPSIDKGDTPVAKPPKALEQVDGAGTQKSQHLKKDQPRVMRYLKR